MDDETSKCAETRRAAEVHAFHLKEVAIDVFPVIIFAPGSEELVAVTYRRGCQRARTELRAVPRRRSQAIAAP